MTNERLRAAIVSSPDTVESLSARVGLDPKTIERWISTGSTSAQGQSSSRRPGAGRRRALPLAEGAVREQDAVRHCRGDHRPVPQPGIRPSDTWRQLIRASVKEVSLLAFAASFLHDTLPDFDDLLAQRASSGVRVRLLFGDPASEAVAVRGVEEQIGSSLADRCRLSWKYLSSILEVPGIEARRHGCTLYASIFRFDDDLLANHHLFGAPANHSPVAHLRRVDGGRLFDVHMASFERVWELGQAVTGEDLA